MKFVHCSAAGRCMKCGRMVRLTQMFQTNSKICLHQ